MLLIKNKNLNGKKILITGGGGFIGSALALHFARNESFVDLLDCCFKGLAKQKNLHQFLDSKRVRTFQGDIRNSSCFSSLQTGYDYVIHAAAVLGIKKVCREPLNTLEVNIEGTRNCLHFCKENPALQRAVIFSTSEVYGPHADCSSEGDDLVVPASGLRWCYSSSKIAAEQISSGFAQEYQIPVSVVRPFNIYGPMRFGGAISAIAQTMLMDRPVMISGSGKQVRSWCYINDFVKGIEKMLFANTALYEVFNIGNPETACSVLELSEIIRVLTNSSSPLIVTGSEESDVLYRVPDIQKAKKLLNYKPQVSLKEGLQETIDCFFEDSQKSELCIAA